MPDDHERGGDDVGLADRIFAAGYDRVLASSERAGLTDRRRELLADLVGEVVELGAGTGANLEAYGPQVARLTLLEPSAPMAARLRRHVATADPSVPVEVLGAPGEAIPLADASADAVVATLVLCTVDDVGRTLDEVARVLRPGGRFVLLEHVVAPDAATAAVQRVLRRPWRTVARGCRLDRDPRRAMAERGWDVRSIEDVSLPTPRPVRHGQVGHARPPADASTR